MENLSEKIRETMVRTCIEKDKVRCSNENTDDGSERTSKDRKTETEVE